ncbi:TIGR03085 family protein [Tessaracoccus sp. SD287]|uniref:TIGR03085 family metal-binding protein n=1 Tax=Tessaracoccus sp. SD287 TaxID=2782008 RepID=UPI001A975EC9|nr:TIGR03085 family metal-binding protein [Tessaracoccus sp. SD287]MBO1030200.1 TIGR03085 family protein [Tessaracoccus sp. SD287]
MTTFAQSERALLADLFDDLGPQAPTLCDGWTTGDLAAHLVVRESDPVGAVGIGINRLEGFTRKRMDAVLAQGSWTQVVERVRRGSRVVGAVPGLDTAMNSAEFFIHHEDVRRAGATPAEPRLLLVDHERLLWRQVAVQARLLLRKAPTGVVVENALDPEEPLRVKAGSRTVTLVGKPSEILLWLSGRRGVADVDIIGDPGDVQDEFWAVTPASG